jgi:hypothetical protein
MRKALFYTAYALWAVGSTVGAIGCGSVSELIWACNRPKVTAVSLNPCDGKLFGKETGIPFYLPKPLLIIAKNFRNIEEARTGLTDSAPIPVGFDDQSKYADVNARTNFNGLQGPETIASPADPTAPATNQGTAMKSTAHDHFQSAALTPKDTPPDGLAPGTFYTYHIVFVPDLTQKYGLKIHGGPGEIRAAMNLVNGWQFTGIGPFYMKDSATAQNVLASGISTRLGGQAAADIINASANLGKVLGGKQGSNVGADEPALQRLIKTMGELPLNRVPMTLPKFAEIHVYEAYASCGSMEWREIAGLCFDRDYLGTETVVREYAPPPPPDTPKKDDKDKGADGKQGSNVGGTTVVVADTSVERAAVAGILGLPVNTGALFVPGSSLQAGNTGGTTTPVPAGSMTQVQIGGGGVAPVNKEWNLFKFGCHAEPRRPVIQNRSVTGISSATLGTDISSGLGGTLTQPGTGAPAGGHKLGSDVSGTPAPTTPALINQPIINQPIQGIPPVRPMPMPPPEPGPESHSQ